MKQTEIQLLEQTQHYELVFNHSPILIAHVGKDYCYKMANKKYCEWVGIAQEKIIGLHIKQVLSEKAFNVAKPNVDKTLQGEELSFEVKVPHHSGELKWVTATYIPEKSSNGEIIGLFAFIIDIDEKKRDEYERSLLKHAVDNGIEGFALHDANGNFSYVNAAQSNMYGYQPDELIGKHWKLLYDDEQASQIENEYFSSLLEKGHWRGELKGLKKSGDHIDVEVSLTAVKNVSGEVDALFCSCRDISERKRNQKEVDFLAYHDSLTGLPNRLRLKNKLEELLSLADKHKTLVAVMFIDLDYFKHINDTLGHSIGDKLLKSVAERLKSTLRVEDIVARLSGDEFTVVLSDLIDVYAVEVTLNKLMAAFRTPFNIDSYELFQSISMGISVYPKDASDVETLMKHADVAMYSVKERGRQDYRFYTSGLTDNAYDNLLYRSQLQKAIDNDQFVLHYQPLISFEENIITGFEVLIRWQHPEKGLVFPDKFIKYAEETNLIIAIGYQVIEKACDQLVKWQAMDMAIEKIAINVSGMQLQSGFADSVSEILNKRNIAASQIELEITENFFLKDLQQPLLELQKLRDLGIHLAIDDFGVGYSSLNQLKQLPIDRLKIDRSFVGDIDKDDDDLAIVEAIIVLGKTLKLDITAEGVEKIEQHKLLKRLGCQKVQGYYYAKPQTAEDVPEVYNSINQQLKSI